VLPLQILWALCVYVEAVSVLPQLRMMQKAKVVEKFTAHYVFALGLSRFISCAHWILQIIDGDSFLLQVRPTRPFHRRSHSQDLAQDPFHKVSGPLKSCWAVTLFPVCGLYAAGHL
jgi:hypothetical protein